MSSPTRTMERPGRTDLGAITINDRVVEKIAGQIVADHPDAGAAATRILGIPVPGAAILGTRDSDMSARPKVSATVDGSVATIDITMGVRWPPSIRSVTQSVRDDVIRRLHELTGMDVVEVRIQVTELVTDLPAPSRVK